MRARVLKAYAMKANIAKRCALIILLMLLRANVLRAYAKL